MNKMKVLVLVGVAAVATGAFARPHGGPRPAPHFRPPVVHHHPRSGFWGHGGRNFWPGFVGGVVGSVVGGTIVDTVIAPRTTIVTTPAVVTQPVVVQPSPVVVTAPAPVTTVQNVWVEGRYIDQVQANGAVVRVWQPGHYEQRMVTQSTL